MKNSWTMLATAATVAFFATAVFFSFVDGRAAKAYGLEDSLDALRDVRSWHMRYLQVPAMELERNPNAEWKLGTEMWVECNELGSAQRVRVERVEEGQMQVRLWRDGVEIDYWPLLGRVRMSVNTGFAGTWCNKSWHPRWVINELYEKSAQGFYDIEVQPARFRGDPILLTRTNAARYQREDRSSVAYYTVDSATKLITQQELRIWIDSMGDQNTYVRSVFTDYNVDFPDSKFELPAEMGSRLEDLTVGRGMPQGGMTDEQAARETLRRYLQALIDGNLSEAASLSERSTTASLGTWLNERLGGDIVRIELIGEAVPIHAELAPRQYAVAYTYVIVRNGEEVRIGPPVPDAETKGGPIVHRAAGVSPFTVPGRETRWVVTGGI